MKNSGTTSAIADADVALSSSGVSTVLSVPDSGSVVRHVGPSAVDTWPVLVADGANAVDDFKGGTRSAASAALAGADSMPSLSSVMARLQSSAPARAHADTCRNDATGFVLPGSFRHDVGADALAPAPGPASDPPSLMTSASDDDIMRIMASGPFQKQARHLLAEELYPGETASARLASCAQSLSTTFLEDASRAADTDDAMSVGSEPVLMSPLDRHARDAGLEYTGAPLPDDDAERVTHLCSLDIIDTEPEERYEAITTLLAGIFQVPYVFITLVLADRGWFKSVVGLPGVTQTSRTPSFCAWTLLPRSPEVLVVMDAHADARFRANPAVTDAPHVRFYAGAPLVSSNGKRLGSLCVVDTAPRWCTAEDCNLLCNFAELTMREIEHRRASQRRNFGDDSMPDDYSRSQTAWLVGHMLVFIEGARWTIKYLNPRARELLGMTDTKLVGDNFWEHFTPQGEPAQNPAEQYLDAIEDAMDVSFNAKALTDEGRKIWINFTFRSGTQSQLDDDMPITTIPMDLVSEEGCKSGYWFATISPADAASVASCSAACNSDEYERSSGGAPHRPSIARLLRETPLPDSAVDPDDASAHGAPAGWRGSLDARRNVSVAPQALPAGLQLRQSIGRGLLGPVRSGVLHGERVLVQTIAVSDKSHCAPLRQALLADGDARWAGSILPTSAVLEHGGNMFVVKRLPDKCICSLRTAIHENFFKKTRSVADLAEGSVSMDGSKVLTIAAGIAKALAALHGIGAHHGDVSDATVMLLSDSPAAGATLPGSAPLLFSSGAPHQSAGGSQPVFDDVASIRDDYPLFVAPERVAHSGELLPGSGAADVWSLGVLLAYLYRFSLPVLTHGPRSLVSLAQQGRVASEVLGIDDLPAPKEYRELVSRCLDANPAARPGIGEVCDALDCMQSTAT